jgi:beta-glucanase (GH16 family)
MMKMKRPLTVLFLIICQTTFGQSWNLVWSDEFNANSIDAANWAFETGAGGWGNGELENYTNRPQNALVNNGNLLIISRKEAYSGSSYTSARMKTEGLRFWTYGKVEARIKIQGGKGLWPAFWMLGENIGLAGWPSCGEIDIMEHINSDSTVEGTMHWNNNGAASYGGRTSFAQTPYHLYSVEWDSSAITWFLDGVKYWRGNIAGSVNNTGAFHKPFFILLNQAIGGNWPSNPDGTTIFPDTMFVDYVRVYQNLSTAVASALRPEKRLAVSPNPFFDHLQINLPTTGTGTYVLQLRDVLGSLLFSMPIELSGQNQQSITIPCDQLPPGVFLLSLQGKDECFQTKLVRSVY